MSATLEHGASTASASAEPAGTNGRIPGAVYDVTAVYLGLLTVFGILNNGVVLVLYARYKTLRNPVNLFLINICLGDLSVSLMGTPFTFAANVARRWLIGSGGCTWYAFIVTVCGTEQIVSLAAVSVHRCCLIVRPFTARKMTTRLALLFIALTWLYSLIVSLPPALGWNSFVLEGTGTACSVDWTSNAPGDSSYIIFIFVMVLVIPFSLIVGSYTLLIYAVKQIASSEAARTAQYKADRKVTILVVVMISCFLVAWSPYSVFALYVAASKNNTVSPVAASIPAMFAKACTVYNPVIYFLMNQQFKDAFVDMMCCRRNPFVSADAERPQGAREPAARQQRNNNTAIASRTWQEDISVSAGTEMAEVGTQALAASSRPPIKVANWSAGSSKDSPPGPAPETEETGADQGVTETPVEVFKVNQDSPDKPRQKVVTKAKTAKKHSLGFHKSNKVCQAEQPDNEEP